jgi:hypothetical protein
MLAEVVGHSGHERFRSGNVGFRGRDGSSGWIAAVTERASNEARVICDAASAGLRWGAQTAPPWKRAPKSNVNFPNAEAGSGVPH